MEEFLYQAKKTFHKYKAEMILMTASFIMTLVALGIYIQESKKITDEHLSDLQNVQVTPVPAASVSEHIYVDISGSVLKPNMYEVSKGSRLKHVLDAAGGLSPEADQLFFSRSFNLAQLLQDSEKIYIPSTTEVLNGSYKEAILNVSNVTNTNTTSVDNYVEENSTKISINNASLEELESLPGIGETTAEKIMDNRPYGSIEELRDNKIVNTSTFDKIKDLISE